MAQTATKQKNDVFQIKGLNGLSRSATQFLKQHPSQARLAVTAALEAAAIQFDDIATAHDVPVSISRFIRERPRGSEMVNVSKAAAQLEVSRTTIYDWVEKKGILLGWRSTKRGLTIPAEQIVGPGKVVPGIGRVLDAIGEPELAWVFLSFEAPFADGVARPIDLLKQGRVDDVVGAAAGFGTAVT